VPARLRKAPGGNRATRRGTPWELSDEEQASTILHVRVGCPVDDLRDALFGPSSGIQTAFNDLAGHSDVRASPWTVCPCRAESAPGPHSPAAQRALSELARCRRRVVAFQARGYPTREVQEELSRAPGSAYEYLRTVTTGAQYGDRFAVLIRTSLRTDPGDPGRTVLRTRFVVKYSRPVNALVRGIIARAVGSGMSGTHGDVLLSLLTEAWAVAPASEELTGASPAGATGAPPAGAAAAAPVPPRGGGGSPHGLSPAIPREGLPPEPEPAPEGPAPLGPRVWGGAGQGASWAVVVGALLWVPVCASVRYSGRAAAEVVSTARPAASPGTVLCLALTSAAVLLAAGLAAAAEGQRALAALPGWLAALPGWLAAAASGVAAGLQALLRAGSKLSLAPWGGDPPDAGGGPRTSPSAPPRPPPVPGGAPAARQGPSIGPAGPVERGGWVRQYELFENERKQPFRGYGSSYPGHMLPTDRHRWSSRCGPSPGRHAADRADVEPQLGDGWAWRGGWRVDTTPLGWPAPGVDACGWSYWLDFPWARWPPRAGKSSHSGVGSFVRVRRWVRMAVRTSAGGGALAEPACGDEAPGDGDGGLFTMSQEVDIPPSWEQE